MCWKEKGSNVPLVPVSVLPDRHNKRLSSLTQSAMAPESPFTPVEASVHMEHGLLFRQPFWFAHLSRWAPWRLGRELWTRRISWGSSCLWRGLGGGGHSWLADLSHRVVSALLEVISLLPAVPSTDVVSCSLQCPKGAVTARCFLVLHSFCQFFHWFNTWDGDICLEVSALPQKCMFTSALCYDWCTSLVLV